MLAEDECTVIPSLHDNCSDWALELTCAVLNHHCRDQSQRGRIETNFEVIRAEIRDLLSR